MPHYVVNSSSQTLLWLQRARRLTQSASLSKSIPCNSISESVKRQRALRLLNLHRRRFSATPLILSHSTEIQFLAVIPLPQFLNNTYSPCVYFNSRHSITPVS
ncbi:hypothetical protein AAHA92_14944 [Salvia divinorum]|uniref:Uncharacterized protein n=1 Tax=Salvia divinorum TaxID=28513 RepID=A0ABD1HH42_SALDI